MYINWRVWCVCTRRRKTAGPVVVVERFFCQNTVSVISCRDATVVSVTSQSGGQQSTEVVESCCGVAPHTLYARQGRQHGTRACADVT
jgi:hypothetical protein